MNEILTQVVKERAVRCLNILPRTMLQDDIDFRIAGGCLVMDKPNDYDIFTPQPHSILGHFTQDWEVICQTANAITLKHKGKVVQLCNYWKQTLERQIEAFDFAHIQVGVNISNFDRDSSYHESNYARVVDVYYTDAFIEACLKNRTWIANPNLGYPMSTVLRCHKYYQRGLMTKKSYIVQMVYAMSQVAKRGIDSYADFKHQLDAVDLQFEVDDIRDTTLLEAFNNFMGT